MPTYQVFVGQGALNNEKKAAVAKAITQGHVDTTGAPIYYVQVIINEIPENNLFIGGNHFSEHIWIRGDVRCRTPEANKALLLEISRRVSEASGIDSHYVWIDLCGIASTDILKFNTVFPPAGQEKVWYDSLPDDVKKAIKKLLGGDLS